MRKRQISNWKFKRWKGYAIWFKREKGFINFGQPGVLRVWRKCRQFKKFYEEHAHNENIEILAVNVTDQELKVEHVKQFAHEYSISFPILLDEKGDVSINYEVLSIPTSVIINEEGMIIEQILGPVTEEMLVSKLLSS